MDDLVSLAGESYCYLTTTGRVSGRAPARATTSPSGDCTRRHRVSVGVHAALAEPGDDDGRRQGVQRDGRVTAD